MQLSLASDPAAGTPQSGLRDQNARLVLSYIRRNGAMASAEIARASGLSAQTVSNIVRDLEAKGLLARGEAVKGRVGKPSVPMTLNPKGVYALGLNVGRRTLELVLVDFLGRQVDACAITYDFPQTGVVFDFVGKEAPRILKRNGVDPSRVAGLGVARPNQIWDWLEFMGAPAGALQDWQELDLAREMTTRTGLPVFEENDATSACVAEHLLGRGHDLQDFAYIFLGAFVGGGLVLDGTVVSGRTLNAAAFGPLPVPDETGKTVQLLDVASLHVLESAVAAAGGDRRWLRGDATDWDQLEPSLTTWLKHTSRNLAIASAAITSVVEVEAILVDGAFPAGVRARLTSMINTEFTSLDITGIQKPSIAEGTIGRRARSIGAALLPIHAKFFTR